jgi:hypothetical protein
VSLRPAAGRLSFAGIGNVELRALSRAAVSPPTMPGIVGQRMRRARVWEYPLAEGDLFALTSDGIGSRFELEALAHLPPQELAEALVREHHKEHDDASCVIARVVPS